MQPCSTEAVLGCSAVAEAVVACSAVAEAMEGCSVSAELFNLAVAACAVGVLGAACEVGAACAVGVLGAACEVGAACAVGVLGAACVLGIGKACAVVVLGPELWARERCACVGGVIGFGFGHGEDGPVRTVPCVERVGRVGCVPGSDDTVSEPLFVGTPLALSGIAERCACIGRAIGSGPGKDGPVRTAPCVEHVGRVGCVRGSDESVSEPPFVETPLALSGVAVKSCEVHHLVASGCACSR